MIEYLVKQQWHGDTGMDHVNMEIQVMTLIDRYIHIVYLFIINKLVIIRLVIIDECNSKNMHLQFLVVRIMIKTHVEVTSGITVTPKHIR